MVSEKQGKNSSTPSRIQTKKQRKIFSKNKLPLRFYYNSRKQIQTRKNNKTPRIFKKFRKLKYK